MSETGERRKSKENGESSSKKKPKPRRKITIKDFALGEPSQPYNLVDDVSVQGPKITWPQLLHLAPKVRRQWTKMVSTRRVKTKAMGLVSGRNLQDITPVLNAYVKGQRVSNVYVDEGAQIYVMTEQTMQRLGLKVNAPCKAKMANNSKVKFLGVINGLKIKVCEIEVEIDVYVMPTKGEGYPIILGRPWLMAMQARQDWDGKHEPLDLETSVDEFSLFDYSTSEEESTITDESDSSQAKIMGVVLTNPAMVSSINVPQVEEGKLAKMLANDLTQEESRAYLAMLEGYPKLFIDGYDQIIGVSVVQHHINLKDGAKPVVQQLQRLGVIQQDALLSEVRKLLSASFIYPIEDSEWVSPVVVTPKKNGKWRVCVDYKPLNAATKRDHFPLPFKDEILNEVAGYERYTMCDGYSGYFQIRIAEEDQKKTTFVTPWGCFAYRVMPFGLINAPATFQRFVTHVFQPVFGKSIRVFIDDFCIYSLRALHLEKVNEGLARLQSLGGQLNVDKCHIAESQVTLLGHVVSSRGIEADPSKVQALVSLPSPKSAKELVSFIQKVRYLSRFIHLLSQVVLPLQQSTHRNTFSWSEENEQQFNDIKELLSSLPTIAPPRWEETFYVNPSVGSDSIGTVLMQKDGETSFMRPIYFVSRVMTSLEKDYTVIEQMVMALMFVVGRFRSYLLPNKFVILTIEDTFPLVLQHMDVSARISKWIVYQALGIEDLSVVDFQIELIKGAKLVAHPVRTTTTATSSRTQTRSSKPKTPSDSEETKSDEEQLPK
ncbi:hypothetical protein L7F22_028431 [Adiantum nelumboides]|nr:hypothetical protein [Adiantum nelumboides]